MAGTICQAGTIFSKNDIYIVQMAIDQASNQQGSEAIGVLMSSPGGCVKLRHVDLHCLAQASRKFMF